MALNTEQEAEQYSGGDVGGGGLELPALKDGWRGSET